MIYRAKGRSPQRPEFGHADNLHVFRRKQIIRALIIAKGNKSKAARMLGIFRSSLQRMCKEQYKV